MNRNHLQWRAMPVLLLGLAAGCADQQTVLPTESPAIRMNAASAEAPLMKAGGNAIPDRYIVVFKRETMNASATARQMVADNGGKLHFTYETAIKGFAATLPPQALEAVRRNPNVAYVAEDGVVRATGTQTNATWGLDRIDQRDFPLNSTYNFTPNGTGVRAYVLDTGILTGHAEFGTRASAGYDVIGDGKNGQDCNGHGTHVAGTIGGTTYGVAKAVRLIAVRVLDCEGSGSYGGVIAGVDWVTANHVKPAVANMSLGGGFSQAVNDAVTNSINAGVTYVLAAGNESSDACGRSPASTPSALTVGSTTRDDSQSSFSNWGTCVDVYAPGSDITSAWHTSTSSTSTISGTSMAAPHVAGVVALYLQNQTGAVPAVVGDAVIKTSSFGRLSGLGTGSPNRLLFSGLTAEPPVARIALTPTDVEFTFLRSSDGKVFSSSGDQIESDTTIKPAFRAYSDGDVKAKSTEPTVAQVKTTASTASVPVKLTNAGTGTLEWEVASNRSWLSATPDGGSLSPSSSVRVDATVNASSLTVGTHSGSVAVGDPSAGNSPQNVGVTVKVLPATALSLGTPVGSQSAGSYEDKYYAVTIPAGLTELVIRITGGAGEADMSVRYGAIPTDYEYDCRPYAYGNEETCATSFPAAGTYYIVLGSWYEGFTGITISATAEGPPSATSGLTGTAVSATQINLAWLDNSQNENNFQLQRRMRNADGTWPSYANVATPSANATSFSNTGLTGGKTYQYRIRACNASGCSAWNASASVTTSAPSGGIPAAPTGLAGTAGSATQIKLTWTDAGTDETSFELERKTRNADGTWTAYSKIATPGANATSYSNTGLTASTTYQYRIRACNADGCSPWNNSAEVTTLPAAPTGLTGTVVSSTQINLVWKDASSDETGFELQRKNKKLDGTWTAFAKIATPGANATSYSNTGLTASTTYQYRIRACRTGGCSTWSTLSNIVTTP